MRLPERRILLLITDLKIGGTPTVVRELALRLNSPPETLVDVACLSEWGPVAGQLDAAGIRVFALNARGATDIRAIRRLHRLIGDQQYDTVFSFLIHANVSAAMVASFFRHARFIQSIQTTQRYPRWHWKAQSIAQYAAESIVVPSASVANAALEWADIPQSKIAIISNAIDPDEFSGIAAGSHFPGNQGEHGNPVPIGFIGRLDPIKRIPDLLEAIRRIGSRVHLHIFGEGAERNRIEQRIRELGLTNAVTLHGAVAGPQDALEKIAILVLPSAAEGFGLVLIEAMAAGVAVIGTNVPGIRDVIRDNQTGLMVPAGSPETLAGAIVRLLDDAPLRDRLAMAAKQDVRHRFSWDAVLKQYRELLNLDQPDQA